MAKIFDKRTRTWREIEPKAYAKYMKYAVLSGNVSVFTDAVTAPNACGGCVIQTAKTANSSVKAMKLCLWRRLLL